MQNVPVMLINKIRQRRIQSSAVRALHQKNCAILQFYAPVLRKHSTQLLRKESAQFSWGNQVACSYFSQTACGLPFVDLVEKTTYYLLHQHSPTGQ
jgi:hypothetical protein